MSSTQTESINIYFYELNEKDSAVIQRVVDFGKTQNKPFALSTTVAQAHIIISSDAELDNTGNAVHIKIGDDENQACQIFLKRPLLVTRVMRALDDAVQLIHSPSHASMPMVEPTSHTMPIKHHTVSIVQETVVAELPKQTSLDVNPVVTVLELGDEQPYEYRALVVDDSAAIRKQLELELKASHIYPDFAETGEEALEKIQANQYDLIFLDIILPGLDGYEVCKTMRTKPHLKKTPIIMLSGKTSPLDEVKGVLAGASTYLTKPVKHEQFQQTLQRVAKWLRVFAANPTS